MSMIPRRSGQEETGKTRETIAIWFIFPVAVSQYTQYSFFFLSIDSAASHHFPPPPPRIFVPSLLLLFNARPAPLSESHSTVGGAGIWREPASV